MKLRYLWTTRNVRNAGAKKNGKKKRIVQSFYSRRFLLVFVAGAEQKRPYKKRKKHRVDDFISSLGEFHQTEVSVRTP